MYNQTVIGHSRQRQAFEKLVARDQLPHALLFSGQSGIGKKQVAVELARKLLCSSSDSGMTETIFNAGNCPDFHFRDCKEKEEGTTENIRELVNSLSLKSFSGNRRVVLLDNAEFMPAQAVNALLKILEEPRPGLTFILITASKGRILPTLLSRCQLWEFSPLSPSQVATVLETQPELCEPELPASALPLLTSLLDGSVENITFVREHFDFLNEIQEQLRAVCSGDRLAAVQLAELLAKDKDDLKTLLRIVHTLVRQEMLSAPEERRSACACLLQDLLQLDWLIFQRHLNHQSLLLHVLLTAAKQAKSPYFTFDHPAVTQVIP